MAKDQVQARPKGDWFSRFATTSSNLLGSRWAFVMAIAVVVLWAATGPVFHYSETWQLIINTGTTIVTFLMVFLIQNTQNRDSRAINLKLDELICAIDAARDQMVDIEHLSDEELNTIAARYEKMRQQLDTQHGKQHDASSGTVPAKNLSKASAASK